MGQLIEIGEVARVHKILSNMIARLFPKKRFALVVLEDEKAEVITNCRKDEWVLLKRAAQALKYSNAATRVGHCFVTGLTAGVMFAGADARLFTNDDLLCKHGPWSAHPHVQVDAIDDGDD